jgi:hypothetical protein
LGSDPDAPRVADAVLRRVREHVRKFRDQLRPASRPAEDVRLPELERLFGRIFSSSGNSNSGPQAAERPYTIGVDESLASAGSGRIRLTGRVRCSLAERHVEPSAAVDIVVSYRFVEDGGLGEEACLTITPPAGFVQVEERPYVFRGVLGRRRAAFRFESDPYPADWSGRLKTDVLPTASHEVTA